MGDGRRWIIAVTGASGIRYGLRVIERAALLCDEVHVVFSDAALRVLHDEEEVKLSASALSAQTLFGREIPQLQFHSCRDIGAPIASGSMLCDGMIVVPCSMSTLGAVATGTPQNLIHRAADVTLKEGRSLILVPRETPLSAIHLENMLKLSRLGVRIVPAMPGFYHKPKTIEGLVDMMAMKILDQMGMRDSLVTRWDETVAQRKSRNRSEAE